VIDLCSSSEEEASPPPSTPAWAEEQLLSLVGDRCATLVRHCCSLTEAAHVSAALLPTLSPAGGGGAFLAALLGRLGLAPVKKAKEAARAAPPAGPRTAQSYVVLLSVASPDLFAVSVLSAADYDAGGAAADARAALDADLASRGVFASETVGGLLAAAGADGRNRVGWGERNCSVYVGFVEALAGLANVAPALVHVVGVSQYNLANLAVQQQNARETAKSTYASVDALVAANVPPRVAGKLAPFQREGVMFALRREGRAFIADEMGLGKTIQSIAVVAAYPEDWPVLVVTPSGARCVQEREEERSECGGGPRAKRAQ
jgi:hypothetical protein